MSVGLTINVTDGAVGYEIMRFLLRKRNFQFSHQFFSTANGFRLTGKHCGWFLKPLPLGRSINGMFTAKDDPHGLPPDEGNQAHPEDQEPTVAPGRTGAQDRREAGQVDRRGQEAGTKHD